MMQNPHIQRESSQPANADPVDRPETPGNDLEMESLLPTLIPYIPPTLLHDLINDPAIPLDPSDARFPATVLFADVSGFTALTEALSQQGTQGAEELTRLLNTYFERMIDLLEAEGGEIAKFSGDALTVLFPATDEPLPYTLQRAIQAAEAMQAAMTDFAALPTSVGNASLTMRIGIGVGEVVALQVGGMFGRWEYVVAGDPLRQVAEAEGRAARGETCLSPQANALSLPGPRVARQLVRPAWSSADEVMIIESVLRRYIPSSVLGWLDAGLREWMAVLRPMNVLFIGIGGLDYTCSTVTHTLHTLIQAVQETVYRYEGTLNKVVVDDKGTVLLVLFGAPPLAHQDDCERAVRCALDMHTQAYQGDLASLHIEMNIGIASGWVFAGPVGGRTRREYTAIGDAVNLAARLMGKASTMGGILSDFETYRQTRQRVHFEALAPLRLKGKTGFIRVYRPMPNDPATSHTHETQPFMRTLVGNDQVLIGRRQEVDRLTHALEQLQAGQGHIMVVEGEAGMGKSRLILELKRLAIEYGLTGLIGSGQSIEQQTSYRAWREVLTSYFGLDAVTNREERQHRVIQLVQEMLPEQHARLPLLNDLLNLNLPETDLTASLDPSLRQQNITLLLIALLQAWTQERPLVLVLEDAHWLDSLSWDLAVQWVRTLVASRIRLLLVFVLRPVEPHTVAARSLQAVYHAGLVETLRLEELSPEETVELVTARLGLAAGDLPAALADLVYQRAGGNPFFAEELIFTLRDRGIITVQPMNEPDDQSDHAQPQRCVCHITGDLEHATSTLPNTLQGLLLARIDHLTPERQLVLKVGSVIGRTFPYPTMHYVVQLHTDMGDALLQAHLAALANLDLTPIDQSDETAQTYMFKHILTQQVAYQTLLYAQRRQLHTSVAQWYEWTYQSHGESAESNGMSSDLAPYYPLMVHHYHYAEDYERERSYARLSGEQAAAQFANTEAVVYLSRALALTPEMDYAERYDILRVRERVYDLQGARDLQQHDLSALQLLAEQLNDDQRRGAVALRRANYAEVTGDYPASIEAAQQAIQLTEHLEHRVLQADGYVQWGMALWRQGMYPEARKQLKQAYQLAQQSGIARIQADSLRMLGNIAAGQSDYTSATRYYTQSLEQYRTAGDRLGESKVLNTLGAVAAEQGDYAGARLSFEQYLHLCRTMGDRVGENKALINLGVVSSLLGDYDAALASFNDALLLSRALGHRWGESWTTLNIGLLYHHLGDHQTAYERSQQALELAQEIGDRNSQCYALMFLGHALVGSGCFDEAAQYYQQAIDLRHQLGQLNLAIAPLAGLARALMAQGNVDQARTLVEEVRNYLLHETLPLTDEPVRVYLTCYQVLRHGHDPHASELLQQAHQLLLTHAERIKDETMRQLFLSNIRAHRDLLDEINEAATPAS
ncbi:MAG: tetratricopeptide repeat protein [Chloroflexaceae bacterium]|nr:tetratricopeptide repeat protein [Chloroflexaceae bacterium]